MINYYTVKQFAAANYNCGAYGAGDYSQTQCQTGTTPPPTPATPSGSLADTGMNMILLLVVGVSLVIGSGIYLVKTIHRSLTSNS